MDNNRIGHYHSSFSPSLNEFIAKNLEYAAIIRNDELVFGWPYSVKSPVDKSSMSINDFKAYLIKNNQIYSRDPGHFSLLRNTLCIKLEDVSLNKIPHGFNDLCDNIIIHNTERKTVWFQKCESFPQYENQPKPMLYFFALAADLFL